MLKLKNIPLYIKLFCPLVLMVLLIAGVVAVSAYKDQKMIEAQEKLVAEGIIKTASASKILEKFQTIDGLFYRYLINQSTGNLENGTDKMRELKKQAQALNSDLVEFMDKLAPEESKDLKLVHEGFKKSVIGLSDDGVYDVAIQMMDLDVNFVLKGIGGYSKVYNQFISALEKLQAQIQSQANNTVQKSKREVSSIQFISIVTIGGLCFLIILLSVVMVWTTLKSVQQISQATGNLASGNIDIDIMSLERRDELGNIVNSLNEFKNNQIEVLRLTEDQKRLEQEQKIKRTQDMNNLADQFDEKVSGTIQSLVVASENLRNSANVMKGNADRSQDASTTVSVAAKETSKNVSTVSAATEEMNASAKEISRQVADVVNKAGLTSGAANDASGKVDELNSLAENIGEVVTAIRDIAEQTNLLALNATIEAARAGEAGKGFAVVADEVKKLASETGNKTNEIEDRITQIQNATKSAVDVVQSIIVNINDINEATNSTAAAVQEQDSVINEITRNISEVSKATNEVSGAIENVQVASKETNEAAVDLNTASTNIAGLSENLESSVTEFLNEIRNSADTDSKV